jgi:uncharacterized protein YjlB
MMKNPGFGGEENPDRLETSVEKGEVIVVPAGVGHRLLEDLSEGFEMVGSHPKGKNWDMCYEKEEEEGKVKGISGVGWFTKDPIFERGPVLEV